MLDKRTEIALLLLLGRAFVVAGLGMNASDFWRDTLAAYGEQMMKEAVRLVLIQIANDL